MWVLTPTANILLADPVQMAGHPGLINLDGMRRFLLEQTEHIIGGFGKTPGDPPGMRRFSDRISMLFNSLTDIYHSNLGLAALSTMKEPGLKALDPALCISVEQRAKIDRLRNEALRKS